MSKKDVGDFYFESIWGDYSSTETCNTMSFGMSLCSEEINAIENGTVLDVGTGTGRRSLLLNEHNPVRIVGFDISPDIVRQTTQAVADQVTSVYDPAVADTLQLPFASGSFDYVMCNGVLHHTPDPKQGFEEVARSLVAGGVVRVGLYHPSDTNRRYERIRRLTRWLPADFLDSALQLWHPNKIERKLRLDALKVPIRKTIQRKTVESWMDAIGLDLVECTGDESYKNYIAVKKGS